MSIKVDVRYDTEESLKRYAEAYAEKCAARIVAKFKTKVDSVHVIVDHLRYLFEADIVVHAKGHTIRSKKHANNMRSAVDTAAARVIKQLRKIASKVETANKQQVKHV
jgi:ribosomal subunit interface protein